MAILDGKTIFTDDTVVIQATVSSISASTTASAAVDVYYVDTTGGAVTLTIPSALIATEGYKVTVVDAGGAAGTNNITIATAGSETISGSATKVISTNYDATTITSDGTNLFSQGVAVSGESLPTQTGNSGKFLTTNGTDASWVTIPDLFDCVVATSGGDYTTLEAAINAGHRKIALVEGDYTHTTTTVTISDDTFVLLQGFGDVTLTTNQSVFDFDPTGPINIGSTDVDYSNATKTLTFNSFSTNNLSTVSVGDTVRIGNSYHKYNSLGLFIVSAVTESTLTLDVELPFNDFTGQTFNIMVANSSTQKPSLVVRDMHIIGGSSYFNTWNSDTWFSQFKYENCIFSGDTYQAVCYDSLFTDIGYAINCNFNNDSGSTQSWYWGNHIELINCSFTGKNQDFGGSAYLMSRFTNCKFDGVQWPESMDAAITGLDLYLKRPIYIFKNCDFRYFLLSGTSVQVPNRQYEFAGCTGYLITSDQSAECSFAAPRVISASATIYAGEEFVIADSVSATLTLTIETSALYRNKRPLVIKDIGNAAAANVTIATEGSETIDGAATATISTNYGVLTLIPSAGNWYTI